jgi:tripartite-type tricarboxylate transporter receptor subunit TctC
MPSSPSSMSMQDRNPFCARRCALFAFSLLAFMVGGVAPLVAQDYPQREIRSICNFAAGSGADILVRYYSDKLSRLAGKPVIVENRPGALGNIATEFVAKAAPDGYTINIGPLSSTLASAPHIFKKVSFDPLKDFITVASIAKLSFVLAVDAKGPIHTVAQLVEHLKKKPGDGMYGAGNNSGLIGGELFKDRTGLKTTYVPYKTSQQAVNDVMGGQLDFFVYDATFTVGQARAGLVRIIAATSGQRSPALGNVPTLAEAGLAGIDITPWWGVAVPAGVPRPIVEKLAGWFNQISAMEETKTFLSRVATDPFPGTPEATAALLRADYERWGQYVKLAKIEPQ